MDTTPLLEERALVGRRKFGRRGSTTRRGEKEFINELLQVGDTVDGS